jgi:hypothetical protein
VLIMALLTAAKLNASAAGPHSTPICCHRVPLHANMAVMELEVAITIVPATATGLVQPEPVVASAAQAMSAHWLPLQAW